MNLREAAQQALEAWSRPNGINYVYFRPYMEALRTALAEPEQEPVAWRDPRIKSPGQGCTYDKAKHDIWPHLYPEPLYTHPVDDTALLRQALEALEFHSAGHDIDEQLITALRERLGEKT